MKVLTSTDGKLVSLPATVSGGTDHFEILTTEGTVPKGEALTDGVRMVPFGGNDADPSKVTKEGIVAEWPEQRVKQAVTAAAALSGWMEAKDFTRDLRFIAKALSNVEIGAKVGVKHTATTSRLLVPEAARPAAPDLKVGDRIAIGSNISPRALMNARGIVTAVNGTKVTVNLTEGDLRRVNASTSREVRNPIRIPKVCAEADA